MHNNNFLTTLIALGCLLSAVSATLDAAESPFIRVDGKPLEFFSTDQNEYTYYLPCGTEKIPEVQAGPDAAISAPDAKNVVTVSLGKSESAKTCFQVRFERLPELDLFLCLGQSNMAGRAPMKSESGDLEPIPNVYLFTPHGNWVPARNPLNSFSSIRKEIGIQKIGPVYAFAQQIAGKTGRPVGLVVNALGGSAIEQWMPGHKDDLYGKSMKRALEAKSWGNYKAILWHQGESNTSRASVYPERLKKVVANVRQDLGDANLFFAAGEIAHWKRYSKGDDANKTFNTMLNRIETHIANSGVVSAESLKPLGGNADDPHFDRASQLILGNRYADLILEKVYGKKPSR